VCTSVEIVQHQPAYHITEHHIHLAQTSTTPVQGNTKSSLFFFYCACVHEILKEKLFYSDNLVWVDCGKEEQVSRMTMLMALLQYGHAELSVVELFRFVFTFYT